MEMNMFSSNEHAVSKQNALKKLNDLKPDAKKYSDLINIFQAKLRAVSSSDDFSSLIEEIVTQGNKLHEELFISSGEPIPYKVQDEMFIALEKDKELSPFLKLLRYSQTFHKDFIITGERLKDAQLAKELSGDKLAIVRKCINDLKSLKPTAELIEEQVKIFQERLAACTSLDELEGVEAEIKILDKAMQTIYDTMVAFPEDEETAGIVIDYVENAPHLQLIMKRFNLLESLADDILDNTARLHETMSLS